MIPIELVIQRLREAIGFALRREKVIKSEEARKQEKIEEEKIKQLPEEAKQPEKVEPKTSAVKIDENVYYAGSQAELEAAYYDLCRRELRYDYLCGPDPNRCVDCSGKPIEPELYKYKCPEYSPEGYKYRELRRYSEVYVCCRKETCLEYQNRLYREGVMRYEWEEEKKDPFTEFRERCASLGGGIMTKESYEVTKRSTTAREIKVLEEFNGWVCVQFIY
jgi:hypothetical protein